MLHCQGPRFPDITEHRCFKEDISYFAAAQHTQLWVMFQEEMFNLSPVGTGTLRGQYDPKELTD